MIKGTYIFYENGKEIGKSNNVITKFGKRFITNFIAGNMPSTARDIAIGIDTTTATENDTRFGFEFFEWLFNQFGAVLTSLDTEEYAEGTGDEFTDDLMAVITVFTSRYYGSRKYKETKSIQKRSDRKSTRLNSSH